MCVCLVCICIEYKLTECGCIGFENFGKRSKEPQKAKESESKSKQGMLGIAQ